MRSLSVVGSVKRRVLLLGLCIAACRSPHAAAPRPTKAPSESELGRVTLTESAEARLGIAEGLLPIELRRLPERRLFGGEVMAMPGRAALLSAPLAGTVNAPPSSAFPTPGMRVVAGQLLAALTPLLGPGERTQVSAALVDAEAQVARAQVQDEATELALSRAEKLHADQLAGDKLVEEARAQRETARAALRAARTQHETLRGGAGRGGLLSAIRIEAPVSGVLREVRVAPHQQVAALAPLFDVVSDDPLWVRVPIPSADRANLVEKSAALIGELTPAPSADGAALILAPPVDPPPQTAQPDQGTIDEYFSMAGGRFRLGQRVAVWLARRGDIEQPVFPASAILYDTAGAAWVYESRAPHVYVRRRVEVTRIEGPLALISARSLLPGGLAVGARVATVGAMELFGSELGAGK